MFQFAVLLLVAGFARGGRFDGPSTRERAVDKAVERGVGYLLGRQRDDGSIQEEKHPTTMTALTILALSSVGHLPTDETPEGTAMLNALEFVLRDDRVEENGYFGGPDGSRMYGHGIVTLMLAEMLGMGADEGQDERIRKRLEKAVALIVAGQKDDSGWRKGGDALGGWRYHWDATDSDLSATIWQLLSLRAAKNAGLPVSKEIIDNSVEYVKRCYHSPRDESGKPTDMKSGCAYIPGHAPGYASVAAGLLALQVCGEHEAPEVRGSSDWLRDFKVKYDTRFFFYGTYYYAQGMYQRGGDYASHAKEVVETILTSNQQGDGAWRGLTSEEQHATAVYSTAMALLSLSIKYHYLPIYQR